MTKRAYLAVGALYLLYAITGSVWVAGGVSTGTFSILVTAITLGVFILAEQL